MARKVNKDGQSWLRRRIEQSGARRKGRLDGDIGLHCPIPAHSLQAGAAQTPNTGASLESEEIWTPFIRLAHDAASARSNEIAGALAHDNQQLIVSIYRHAANLVREHETSGHALAAARGRFQVQVEQWLAQLAAHRSRAEAARDRANLQIDAYWDELRRAHHRRHRDAYRCAPLTPVRVVLDPTWTKADPFLLLQFGAEGVDNEATARAGRLLDRAIDLLNEEDE